jgi:hypothetical protein
MKNSTFIKTNFNNSLFQNIVFDSSVFVDSNELYKATFKNAEFSDVSFKNCNLKGVDFSYSKFAHVDFQNAKVAESNFYGADLSTCKGLTLDMIGVMNIDSTKLPIYIENEIFSNLNEYKCIIKNNKVYEKRLLESGVTPKECN